MGLADGEWFPSRLLSGKFKGRLYQEAAEDGELRSWIEWLAELELEYGIEKAKVDSIRSKLFAALRPFYQERDHSLRRAAERYDKELDKSLQRIMALVMPVVLIIMAGLIGTMAYLMITAIFQTISNLN